MRQRVLIVYLGDLTNVARVWRQAEFLSEHYDVVLASLGPASMPPGVEHLELPVDPRTSPLGARAQSAARVALRLAGRYSTAYWLDGRMRRWRDELSRALPVDAIVVNHLFAVPLAKAVGGRVPVVFDAHEHWTSESASWSGLQRASMRRAHEWIVDRFVSETAGMTTVSEGIAHDFRERVGVAPRLVTNAPPFAPLEPTEVHDPIRLIHIGLADERRRLEDTIAAVRLLDDRFTLDLVLARENEYRRRLEQLAAEDERVRVLPPVPSEQLVAFANDYDVECSFSLRGSRTRSTCSRTSCSTTYRRGSPSRSGHRRRWPGSSRNGIAAWSRRRSRQRPSPKRWRP